MNILYSKYYKEFSLYEFQSILLSIFERKLNIVDSVTQLTIEFGVSFPVKEIILSNGSNMAKEIFRLTMNN